MQTESEVGSGEQVQLPSVLDQPGPQQGSESPEIIQSSDEQHILLDARADLLQHEISSKKERPGVDLVDSTSAAPIPENQNMNMLQHENESSCKKETKGVESIDPSNAAPVPANQNLSMLQHES